MPQYVALIQQGLVTQTRALAVGDDLQQLQEDASKRAGELNAEQKGFGEAWEAAVLPIESQP